jgi:hypothetical protein
MAGGPTVSTTSPPGWHIDNDFPLRGARCAGESLQSGGHRSRPRYARLVDARQDVSLRLTTRAIALNRERRRGRGAHRMRTLLERRDPADVPDAEEIREMFLDQKPTVAMAIFPKEQYTGAITTDLFSDDETSYIDDVDQFFVLQKAAVEKWADEHRAKAAWVEVLTLYTVPWWQFRAAEGESLRGQSSSSATGSGLWKYNFKMWRTGHYVRLS